MSKPHTTEPDFKREDVAPGEETLPLPPGGDVGASPAPVRTAPARPARTEIPPDSEIRKVATGGGEQRTVPAQPVKRTG